MPCCDVQVRRSQVPNGPGMPRLRAFNRDSQGDIGIATAQVLPVVPGSRCQVQSTCPIEARASSHVRLIPAIWRRVRSYFRCSRSEWLPSAYRFLPLAHHVRREIPNATLVAVSLSVLGRVLIHVFASSVSARRGRRDALKVDGLMLRTRSDNWPTEFEPPDGGWQASRESTGVITAPRPRKRVGPA